jgi:hypothetical protein
MLFLQAAIIAILEKKSTTTKTQSFPYLGDERHDMYSMEMDSHGLVKTMKRGV